MMYHRIQSKTVIIILKLQATVPVLKRTSPWQGESQFLLVRIENSSSLRQCADSKWSTPGILNIYVQNTWLSCYVQEIWPDTKLHLPKCYYDKLKTAQLRTKGYPRLPPSLFSSYANVHFSMRGVYDRKLQIYQLKTHKRAKTKYKDC